MRHLQGGVRSTKGTPIRTKKELKELTRLRPETVEFYDTSLMNPVTPFTLDQLTITTRLTIVGPDPYNRRQWYANVTRSITSSMVQVT